MLHHALHIERVVVVQPSVCEAGNASALHAIKQLGLAATSVSALASLGYTVVTNRS